MNINYIAYWGAGLSTLLTIVKLWEFWSSRRRIEVGHNFTSDPQRGNEIIIRNVSSKPFTVTYWSLQFCDRKWLRWIPSHTKEPDFDMCDINLEGNSSKIIHFVGSEYFEWGYNVMRNKRLYISLKIAGKKHSVRHIVYKWH